MQIVPTADFKWELQQLTVISMLQITDQRRSAHGCLSQEKGDDVATEQTGTGRCISLMTHSFGQHLLICRSSKLNAVNSKRPQNMQ